MSSILRALKRVEDESPPRDKSHPWPRPIDSKKAVKSDVKKRWLLNRLVSGLVIFLVVLAAAWFAFTQRHRIFDTMLSEKSPQDTRQASPASIKKKPIHPEKRKARAKRAGQPDQHDTRASVRQSGNTVSEKRPISSGSLTSRPEVPVQKKVTRHRTIKKPTPTKRKIPLKNTQNRSQPVQPSGSRRTPASAPKKQPPAATPAPSAATAAPAKVAGSQDARLEALSTMNNSKLKLQAIAWSEDTAQRMAVINNHIVREGGTVDGYSITNIRKDDVIVNDGTTSWRLEFSLKQ